MTPEPESRFEALPEATPIACSLDGAAMGERADEWRALVAWSVASVEVGALAVHLVLRDSEADLTAAVALAQREKECCPFFDVSLALDSDRRTLVLAVPDGAEETLAAFVALLGE
jgi:anti-sigma-K factor RskA